MPDTPRSLAQSRLASENSQARSSRLIYFSSFEYPTHHAHPLHALLMARAFHHALGERFLFTVGKGDASLNVPYHEFPQLPPRAFWYRLWLSRFLESNPEWRENLIIFTNDLKLAAAAGKVKKKYPFTLIVEVHGTTDASTMQHALRAADQVITTTNGLKEAIERTDALVLPNAVDVQRFAQGNGTQIRKTYGLTDAFVVGYIGRFAPMESDKGVRFMIYALARIQDAHLMLVGGTAEELKAARAWAEDAGVLDRIALVGHVPVDDVADYAAACDVLAYVPPAPDAFLTHETSPMKLFEYMAARKPIIASDTPALHEALGDGTAFLIPPGNEEAYVDAVNRIRTNMTETKERVEAAYTRVADNSWDARAKHILALI